MVQYASTVIVISSTIVLLCFLTDSNLRQQRADVLDEYERQKMMPSMEGIPPSCTLDAQVLCDRTGFIPVQTLMNQDPFVRLIMSPIEISSPASSATMLDNLFTVSASDQHFSQPSFEQEDAVLGSMLETMMASAMRFSAAAEEITPSTYYGTRESAAEETFSTMLTSLFDLFDTSTDADQYYHDPNQLRKKVCSYGQTVLENEHKSTAVDNETRLSLARRLSEVDQDPEPLNELPFVSSIRIIIFDDEPRVPPPISGSFMMKEEKKQCLWDAHHAGEVSHTCRLAMNAIEMTVGADLSESYTCLGNHLLLNFIIQLAAAFVFLATCYGLDSDEDEMDDFEILGNEYHEMSETTVMKGVHGVHTGVPLTMPLRVV